MKRFFKFGALCVAVFALVLTSCSKKDCLVTFDTQGGSVVAAAVVEKGKTVAKPADPTKEGCEFIGWYKDDAGTIAWDFAKDVVNSDITLYAKWSVTMSFFEYYGDYAEAGTENFYVEFKTAANLIYMLDLYSPDIEYLGKYIIAPKAGTYEFDKNSTGKAFTVGAEYSGVGFGEDRIGDFVSGSVKLTKIGDDYKVEGNFVDNKGKVIVFVYQGPFSFELPDPYEFEGEATTVTLTATQKDKGINWDDLFNSGGDDIDFSVSQDDNNYAVLEFIALNTGVTSIPEGRYTIANTYRPGYVIASIGYDGDWVFHFPSYVVKDGNYYYLVSGTVDVTATGFTVNATSARGSTVTVTYTGSLDVEPPPAEAPAKIAPKALKSKRAIALKK